MTKTRILGTSGISLLTLFFGSCLSTPRANAQGTVKLDVVVRDSADSPVTGLKQQDLMVMDNGSSVATTSFAEVAQDSTPPTIVLVFDLINSPQTYAAIQRDQLNKILLANGGQLKFPTLLTVATATGVTSSETPTTDGNSISKALAGVPLGPDVNQRASGGAAALQRVNESIKALNGTLGSASKLPGRKLIFWLGPGWALMGGTDLSPAQEQDLFNNDKLYSSGMRQARETLYMLNLQGASASVNSLQAYRQYLKGVNAPNKTDFADLSLQVLATQSGGLVLNSNDLGSMFNRALADAGPHYEIEIPAAAPAKNVAFHEVQVKVNRPGAVARTRNGYYPQ